MAKVKVKNASAIRPGLSTVGNTSHRGAPTENQRSRALKRGAYTEPVGP